MLTEAQIKENKDRFINILKTVNRPEIETFITYLDYNGFFEAPASTQYNCAFPGGLCLHSLNVYNTLCRLTESFDLDENGGPKHSADTLKIVGLLHDIYKMSYYEMYVMNKKEYKDNGSKVDNLGRFDWVSVNAYKVKDINERIIFGDRHFSTYMEISRLLPLTEEEVVVLVNQYSAFDGGDSKSYLGNILSKYPLAVLLHSADTICAYMVEK